MIRQTSIDAYNEIKENGLLSERRFEVYDALFHGGPLTGMELLAKIKGPSGKYSRADSQVRARLTELREMGVVREIGNRTCSVTGMYVILWDVTKNLPVKMVKVTRHKCKSCKGRGYFEESQGTMFR